MNKLLTAALSVTFAFSMMAPAASADTSSVHKTVADFQDLTSVDNVLKAKIEAMLESGTFEGITDNRFGIQERMTRAQFAKVLTSVFGLHVETGATTSGFTDVPSDHWALSYIETAKKAGLIEGMTDTTFAPEESVTLGQFATVLLKGVKKQVDTSGSPWYAQAMKDAAALGFVSAQAEGGAAASRADLVIGAYAAIEATKPLPAPVTLSMLSASVVDAKTVKVIFDREVDRSKGVLTLSRGDSNVATETEWAEDGKSATLKLKDTALVTGDYTVKLSGINTGIVKIGTATFSYAEPTVMEEKYVLPVAITTGTQNVSSSGIITGEVAGDPTQSKFAKEIKVTAKTASGETIALPAGVIQSAVVTDPSVVKLAVTTDHRAYILGLKPGTAEVMYTYQLGDGVLRSATAKVEVKSDNVAATRIEVKNTNFTETATVVNGVYRSEFNAFTSMGLIVHDNYGNKFESIEAYDYNFAYLTFFYASNVVGDPAEGPVGTVDAFYGGNVRVIGNVTGFELRAIARETVTGVVGTSYVTIKRK
ncbi:S-layer homology domain-containing protein [Paenibacillus chartarius]|uniref:S-layer homology domain-containing protein n=1 Tax=Paenibacillus chartarius TaxID=747481 RepID=A0ABV6DQE7_9BACL